MKTSPGTLLRYSAGPTALIKVLLDNSEHGQVYGMQCVSGEGMHIDIDQLRPAAGRDAHEWEAHAIHRAPREAHHNKLAMKGNSMNDFSIDCETLSTHPNAAVVSIGVVNFDRDTGKIGESLHILINVDDAIKHGHVSGSTMSWWIAQGGDARSLFDKKHDAERTNCHGALCRLKGFIAKHSDRPRVWGNGSIADITWLDSLFNSAGAGMKAPWEFWDVRDMRTTMDDADLDMKSIPREGTHHNAVDDALHQAKLISMARRKIRAALGMGVKAAPAEKNKKSSARYWRDDADGKYFTHVEDQDACTEVDKAEYDGANKKRYWHHAESDGYVVTKPLEFPSGIDGELCREITQAEYDEANEL